MRIILLALLCLPMMLQAQKCNCVENLEWTIKTFTENDAGAAFAIQEKGQDLYEKHTATYLEKAKSIDQLSDCTPLLYEWLTFFRSGHMGIRINPDYQSTTADESEEEIMAKYKDAPRHKVDIDAFKAKLDKTPRLGLEGIWQSGSYTIGIEKVKDNYIGFIVEADGVYWHEKQIKMEIRPSTQHDDYEATYYMRDHSPMDFERVELMGNAYFKDDLSVWKRIYPYYPPNKYSKAFEADLEYTKATEPFAKELSDQTMIVRIPSFNYNFKTAIDSVLAANDERIKSHKNLIIDLRGNGGGSDFSFAELMPYIYTNKIKHIGLSYFSGPESIKIMKGIEDDPESEEEWRPWAQHLHDEMLKYPGEFVDEAGEGGETVYYEEAEEILAQPAHVAILIDEGCGSTTEEFIMAAKQSRKVKFYGRTTAGAIDVSNVYELESPNKQFFLYYAMTRSKRIPHFVVDDRGMHPDFYLDDSIPNHKWIEYVQDLIED